MTALPDEVEATVASFYEFILLPAAAEAEAEPVSSRAPEPSSIRRSDRIVQALKPLRQLEELFDAEAFATFTSVVVPAAADLCPADERDELLHRLAIVWPNLPPRPEAAPATPVTETEPAVSAAAAATVGTQTSAGQWRFDLVLSHLTALPEGSSPRARNAMVAELIRLAAEGSRDAETLRARLRRVPLHPSDKSVFHVLARTIDSWDIDVQTTEETMRIREAVLHLVRLSPDANERARRIRDVAMAAIERLHDSAIYAGVTMLELAEEVLATDPIHETISNRIRTDALREFQEKLDQTLLGDRNRHPLLNKALAFFPDLRAEALIEELLEDPEPARLESLRGLLEVIGAPARGLALSRLTIELASDQPAATQRIHRLLELLIAIPRHREVTGAEIEALAAASTPGRPVATVCEALQAIVTLPPKVAERLLAKRLGELESIPFRTDKAFYSEEELHSLLDSVVAALARVASPVALRAAVRHGLNQSAQLGDTRHRLRHLATLDLTGDPDTVHALATAIREELPARILGRTLSKKNQNPVPLLSALRSTKSVAASALIREIASEFPQTEVGLLASNIVQSQARHGSDVAAENRSGSLGYFDLPRLLLSLRESRACGVLSLVGADHSIRGRLWLRDGTLLHVESEPLTGEAALLQLIERPVAGSWIFAERRIRDVASFTVRHLDMDRLIAEGIRRHAALAGIETTLPGTCALEAGPRRPGRSSENDPKLLRATWLGATSGEPVDRWELTLGADSWRVRRVLAQWLEEGALGIKRTMPN